MTVAPPSPSPFILEQNPQNTTGSWVSRASDVSDLPRDGIKLILYGDNRTGKTTFAATFPKPLLFISVEPARTGGLDSVQNVPGVKCLILGTHFSHFTHTVQIADELARSPNCCGYKTVVLDSATSYETLALASLVGRQLPEQMEFGLVSEQQYRDRSSRAKTGLAAFMDLTCNVIVTAKEKDHNPPKEERISAKTGKVQPDMRAKWLRGMGPGSKFGPAVGQATAGWLNDASASICRMYWTPEVVTEQRSSVVLGETVVETVTHETGDYVLAMRLKQHPNYMGGLRACDHESVPAYLENPTYDSFVAVLRSGGLSLDEGKL